MGNNNDDNYPMFRFLDLIIMALSRPTYSPHDERNPNKPWLDKNESITATHKKVSSKILKSLANRVSLSYPDLYPLYLAISEYVCHPISNLYIDNGSDGIIRKVFETFTRKGDIVFMTSPSFAMYNVYAQIYEVNAINVPYYLNDSGCVKYRSVCSHPEFKPRLVCLPNPDSPTGTILDDRTVLCLAEELDIYGGILFIDEVYYGFHPITYANIAVKYTNVVIGRSFSKAWGAAGARVGFCIADKKLIESLSSRRSMYEIGALSCEYIKQLLNYRKEIEAEVNRICDVIKFANSLIKKEFIH